MRLSRLWPLALMLAALGVAYALGVQRHLSFEALAAHRATLAEAVAARPLTVLAAYVALYVAIIAFSIPVGLVMTLAGGLLFGPWLGAALAVVSATIGASLLHLMARQVVGDALRHRAGPRLDAIREGLQRDGFWYLLTLRLVPVVPFWLVNFAPSLVGMRLAPFAAATLLGIAPATTVFAGIGAGLGQVFDRGERPDLTVIFSPGILLPLLGLAGLSLLGAWWRARQRRMADA